jgi:hypothetical protein
MHQHIGQTWPTIVSHVGWLVALRGLFLLAFPDTFFSLANSVIDAQTWWRGLCIAFAAVGLYLAYVGWIPAPGRKSQPASSTPDLPRAA